VNEIVLNIWMLMVAAALAIVTLVYTIWKRPRVPLMTLILILELIFFLAGLNAVNSRISPAGNSIIAQENGTSEFILRLILSERTPPIRVYEAAFSHLQGIVLFLLIATILTIAVETYTMLIKPMRKEK